MTNSHTFSLTKRQAKKLENVVACFLDSAKRLDTFPPQMLLLISSIHSAILEERGLEQHHIDILVWMLELIFDQFEEDDFDPLLEQVFNKLTGYWPTDKPWYQRIQDVELPR